jgi:hypothetical protein
MSDSERNNLIWEEWLDLPETQEIMAMIQAEIDKTQRHCEQEPTTETKADNFVLMQTFRTGKLNGLRYIAKILSVKKAKTEQDAIHHRTQGDTK